MKKTLLTLVCVFATALVSLASASAIAASFEGRIKMKMQPAKGEPQIMSYAVKGQRLRMEMPSDEETMVSLLDWEKREMSVLMPDQTMYRVIELKDVPAMDQIDKSAENTTLEKTSETARIVGRDTTKYIAREGKNVTDLWLAPDIGSWFNMGGGEGMQGKKLSDWEKEIIAKGLFPLRMITYDQKSKPTMTMEVVELTPQKLDDSLFVPPAGYTRFSMGNMLQGLGK